MTGAASSGEDCVAFLQWALPRMGRRWAGYRKVRRQVCRRIRRRARELGLESLGAYRGHLERHPEEWAHLDGLTNVTISRFHRDRGVFAFVASAVLPALAADARDDGREVVRAWSAGCAGGEEAYTLAILSALAGIELEVLGTDVDPTMLRRARRGRYAASTLRELPDAARVAAFAEDGEELVLLPRFRGRVTLAEHDVRTAPPAGPFDLVLCRNLVFTYLDDAGQRAALERIAGVTRPGGALVVGAHEALPATRSFEDWNAGLGVFRRVARR